MLAATVCVCCIADSCAGRPSNFANCQTCGLGPMCTCRPGFCNPVPSASWAAGGAQMCVASARPCPVGNARCPAGQVLVSFNGNLFCDRCPTGCASCSSVGTCDVCAAGFNRVGTTCGESDQTEFSSCNAATCTCTNPQAAVCPCSHKIYYSGCLMCITVARSPPRHPHWLCAAAASHLKGLQCQQCLLVFTQ